ncbi:NnrS family protein [Paracoccus zhejiangensis]|uniref:NnrS family protein n=1 Tax=Paracoccus zhejiangensis TaxID=1077935 RepID=A0A2H5F4T7_9RHOB|nr:NnrS family protein [Paracoccus zhejiangensis]AUH66561.1 NnrS family protein [Paracoccus zhejiangensis]
MTPIPLFTAGWRAFFLAAGLWAVISVAVWMLWLAGYLGGGAHLGIAPSYWHAHEMIFGYASAAIAGFFLTAVPNWTGAKPVGPGFILLALTLWLAGRLALCLTGLLPPLVVALVDLAFLPVLAAKLLMQLMERPKPQNLMLLIMLTLLWTANLMLHLDWLGLASTGGQGLRGGLLILCAMIAVLGGRVTPAFTRNALQREGRTGALPVDQPVLTGAGIALAILTALAALAGLPDPLTGGLALLAGLVAALRLSGWSGLQTARQPILWSLHLGYALLALGLGLWGLALMGHGSETGALHVLGIGAVGSMTLAVMSRAALGHSGRALIAPRAVALAYALMPLAVAFRWAGSAGAGGFYQIGVFGSGLLWCLAFLFYLAAMLPVFLAPRSTTAAA